jgi:hypothetical protein
MSDYRLWCLAKPIGFFKPYKVGSDFNSGEVKTHGYTDVSRIGFPNMGKYGDPHYEYISDKKDALLESQYFDADKLEDPEELEQQRDPEEIEREVHIDIAQRLREEGKTLKEVGSAVGVLGLMGSEVHRSSRLSLHLPPTDIPLIIDHDILAMIEAPQ